MRAFLLPSREKDTDVCVRKREIGKVSRGAVKVIASELRPRVPALARRARLSYEPRPSPPGLEPMTRTGRSNAAAFVSLPYSGAWRMLAAKADTLQVPSTSAFEPSNDPRHHRHGASQDLSLR